VCALAATSEVRRKNRSLRAKEIGNSRKDCVHYSHYFVSRSFVWESIVPKGFIGGKAIPAAPALFLIAMSNDAKAASIKSTSLETIAALTNDDGEEATDISGVSCLSRAEKHVCLVIDDQGRLAQLRRSKVRT
jgi:hypothetical protein